MYEIDLEYSFQSEESYWWVKAQWRPNKEPFTIKKVSVLRIGSSNIIYQPFLTE